MIATAHNTRICEGCLEPKPVTDFRLRYRGGATRMARCRDCHNRAERERRQRNNRLDNDRRMSRGLAQIQGERSNKRVVVLYNTLLNEFGGVQGFVDNYRDFYNRSKGLDRMRCFKAMLSLVRVAGSLR